MSDSPPPPVKWALAGAGSGGKGGERGRAENSCRVAYRQRTAKLRPPIAAYGQATATDSEGHVRPIAPRHQIGTRGGGKRRERRGARAGRKRIGGVEPSRGHQLRRGRQAHSFLPSDRRWREREAAGKAGSVVLEGQEAAGKAGSAGTVNGLLHSVQATWRDEEGTIRKGLRWAQSPSARIEPEAGSGAAGGWCSDG
ncbi:hypothetical protein B0H19DRAFT_1084107 [Mycena capillaripes]|nr:hypothetical protein B0H19DRAFT_1084107 [Mycena capillaripes]